MALLQTVTPCTHHPQDPWAANPPPPLHSKRKNKPVIRTHVALDLKVDRRQDPTKYPANARLAQLRTQPKPTTARSHAFKADNDLPPTLSSRKLFTQYDTIGVCLLPATIAKTF